VGVILKLMNVENVVVTGQLIYVVMELINVMQMTVL
jgi:hypothetical protein